jgi:segregation and condensation protein A
MYKLKLPNFEGPFDLLLYFIKKDEINIYDIPIARITEEFLKYIKLMKLFDLELAGEFLVMAANLIYIKTQLLLPREIGGEEIDIEDPRTQLVQQLIEYKQFKEAALDFARMAEDSRYYYYRALFEDSLQGDTGVGQNYKNATLFDLIRAFRRALDRTSAEQPNHLVELIAISVEDKINFILSRLNIRKRIRFFQLFETRTPQHIVATFLAMLELLKSQRIVVRQSDLFDEIIISARKPQDISLN